MIPRIILVALSKMSDMRTYLGPNASHIEGGPRDIFFFISENEKNYGDIFDRRKQKYQLASKPTGMQKSKGQVRALE